MRKQSKHNPEDRCRLACFKVETAAALRFERQVPHGERGNAQEALFNLMMKATEKHRRLWDTLLNHPEMLEIRRKS